MMANVVLTVLSMTIGFFFILVGTLKLSPAVNEEVYREMVSLHFAIRIYRTYLDKAELSNKKYQSPR